MSEIYPELNSLGTRMPDRAPEAGIGLCLSGGGFRATLFCLGAIWRLNDACLLPKLSMISSVSGGSIVSGVLALAWRNLGFDNAGFATRFEDLVASPIRDFCGRNVAVPAAVFGILNPFRTIGDEMVRYYESLYQGATLQDLPDVGSPT